jgi:DNA-damage-inducible protein D
MAADELDVFHLGRTGKTFEDFGHTNGGRFWYGRDLMALLGYQSFAAFDAAVNRAIRACATLNIPPLENFRQIERDIDGKSGKDYELTRFACYLTTINGDVNKPQVAKAQTYFAAVAEAARQYFQDAGDVERVIIREEVSEREKSLAGVARLAGVQQYGLFQNAGYRGLYNLDLWRLREIKGVELERSILDFMGKQELAANLFRITQTEAKIKNHQVRGQALLEDVAEDVGRRVRKTMIEISGTHPEALAPAEDIRKVRRGLKKTEKEFAKLDSARRG